MPARTPDFELTAADLRSVTAFALACAELVIDLFVRELPEDARPSEALAAAREFVHGAPRSRAQRMSAPAAHRAARMTAGAPAHAAMAAGDAAASAYLHPLADPAQVGHILRGPAHVVLALGADAHRPHSVERATGRVLALLSPTVVDVLGRYPRLPATGTDVARTMAALQSAILDH